MGGSAMRDRLIASGHRLFQSQGDLRLSGPEICDFAGVKSVASINQKFRSLDGLLGAVLEAEFERYLRHELSALSETSTTSRLGRIKNFVSLNTTGVLPPQVAAGFLFANVAAGLGADKQVLKRRTQEILLTIETQLVGAIAAARQAHEVVATVDTRLTAFHIFAGIQKVRLDARLTGSNAAFAPFLADCGKILGRNIW